MTITDEERMRRQAAVTFARANIELEGFRIPPDAIERMERFVNGELTLTELISGDELVPQAATPNEVLTPPRT
ncbi:antitoxin VbhA family protein [Burkholderia glumae]|uniref:antitoxin VbhA family protein n=1 Tax=Burkholderia glumae TaxID=337 RepID=UPI0021516BAC|nr:antitoxin VbhA family protein [Burkholderia glumae]